jgi:hypothetical protein
VRDGKGAADFERSTTSALSLQGLALLCTALVQTSQNQLTLFHAIVVLHLLALLGINLASRGRYRGNELARSLVDIALAALAAAAFVAFNVLVWANAPTFGLQPECNDSTIYVIFGVSVRDTGDVLRRRVFPALLGLTDSLRTGAPHGSDEFTDRFSSIYHPMMEQLGARLFTLGFQGPDWDYSLVESWLRWRDAKNA